VVNQPEKRSFPWDCGLIAVIGMARENGDRAIELLGQHGTDKLVGPGHGPESEGERRFFEEFATMAVRAADGEDEFGSAGIAPSPDPVGEIPAGQGFSRLVQRDKGRARRGAGKQRGRLLFLAERRRRGAAF
jgi:hypothetical protein